MTSISKELIASLIPNIRAMAEKERAMLEELRSRRRSANAAKIDVFIEQSQWWLDHYTARLKQYERYVAA